jgi:DNA oxidative demethylase
MVATLFEDLPEPRLLREAFGPGTAILNGFALGVEAELVFALKVSVERAPLRHMVSPGGFRMSVGMANCGRLGWVTDRTGYRYEEIDPEDEAPMPSAFEAKGITSARVVSSAIDSCTDRNGCDYFACTRVGYRHHSAAASATLARPTAP